MQFKKDNNSTHSIYNVKDGFKYIVTSAPELGILKSLGIVKDAIVHKQRTYKFGGPVLLKVESSEIAIGKDIAENIAVRR